MLFLPMVMGSFRDAISIAKRTGALVIAPNELAVYCQMQGVENVHNAYWWCISI